VRDSQIIVSLFYRQFIIREFRSYVAHEKRHNDRPKWTKKDRIHKDFVLPVRIGLTQSNLEKGHSYLMDVSDPKSPNYAQYWTAHQVHEAFAPSKEAVAEVIAWLNSSGVSNRRVVHSENKGWLAFDARSHEVESLLRTEYHEFHHENGEIRAGTNE
jgi:tripeptidyl-peptidase I